MNAHASGTNTQALGQCSFTHGNDVQALTEGSVAIGNNCIAGSMGFGIIQIDINNKYIYLVTALITTAFGTPEIDISMDIGVSIDYEVGDQFTLACSSARKVLCARITEIHKNRISYDTEIEFDSADYDKQWIFKVPHRPTVGTIHIGSSSISIGLGCRANDYGAQALGDGCLAADRYSHAEGYNTTAGLASHAEGASTVALGQFSHSEGNSTKALGNYSHAEGFGTEASGELSHTEGQSTIASGTYAHAEGHSSKATEEAAHAEGAFCEATGKFSHAEGRGSKASGKYSHSEGASNATADYSHAEGVRSYAKKIASHAEGVDTVANGYYSHAEGQSTTTSGYYSHAEGYKTVASASGAHAEGDINKESYALADGTEVVTETINTASGKGSHVEGTGNTASNTGAHAEGIHTVASGVGAHAEGQWTYASGVGAHAEGGTFTIFNPNTGKPSCAFPVYANGDYSHAEGSGTTTNGCAAHAEGKNSIAHGYASHAEGSFCIANADYSHVEGYQCEDRKNKGTFDAHTSHVEGYKCVSASPYSHVEGYECSSLLSRSAQHVEGTSNYDFGAQHVQGRFNQNTLDSTTLHVVGNGTASDARSNAHTLKDTGEAWYAGAVTSTGADYAEYFEWLDGNPDNQDRVGLLVTLDMDKIRIANSGDEILGIISGTAAVLGDNYEDSWNGRWLTDDFGRIQYEDVEEFIEVPYTEYKEVEQIVMKMNEDTGEEEKETIIVTEPIVTIKTESVGFFKHPIVNPDYDPEQEYVNRANRPEWSTVGMLGKLYVRDDGTCQVNGYAIVSENGVATDSTEKTNMRVLSRVNDNVIRVLLK